MRVFGSLVFASTLRAHRTKFQPRARQCVFIGYNPGIKGYKLYDVKTGEVFMSRNVVFHENYFPFKCVSRNVSGPDLFNQIVFPRAHHFETHESDTNQESLPRDTTMD